MSDDLTCLCVTNHQGFIIQYSESCPWPGHAQLTHVNPEKLRKLVDAFRTGSSTSGLIIQALKVQAKDGNILAQALVEEMQKYIKS